MIALCFFFLPFTYFYSEEKLESEDGDLDFDAEFDDSEYDSEINSTRTSSIGKGKKKSSKEGKFGKFWENSTKAFR